MTNSKEIRDAGDRRDWDECDRLENLGNRSMSKPQWTDEPTDGLDDHVDHLQKLLAIEKQKILEDTARIRKLETRIANLEDLLRGIQWELANILPAVKWIDEHVKEALK